MLRAVLVVATLVAVACSGVIQTPAPPTTKPVAKGTAPSTTDEKLAIQYLLDNEDDPASVEVMNFGPHKPPRNPGEGQRIRIRYRAKNKQAAIELFVAQIEVKNGKAAGWQKWDARTAALMDQLDTK